MKNNNRNRKLDKIRKKNAFRKGLGRVAFKVTNEFLLDDSVIDFLKSEIDYNLRKIKYNNYKAVETGTTISQHGIDILENISTVLVHFKLVHA